VRAPSTFNAAVPPELDRITLRALSPNPAGRYQLASALADELDAVLHALRFGAPQAAALVAELFGPAEVAQPAPRAATTRTTLTGRGLALLIGSGLVLGVAGAGVWLALRESPAVAPVRVEQVVVTVRSEPPGAQVWVEGEATPRGAAPLTLSWPRAAHPARLRLELAGHSHALAPVSDEPTQQLDVRLNKKRVDVEGGAIVEPFEK
jgi:hypothetical protein